MKQLAQARIVSWQGGSLWLLRTLQPRTDTLPRTDFHAHHAVQIVLSLGGQCQVWQGDEVVETPYIAVAPNIIHRFDADGAYALLFVEPESRAGRAIITETFTQSDLTALPASRFTDVRPQLAALARDPSPSAPEMVVIGQALVDGLAGARPPRHFDARIQAVIRRVGENHDQSLTLAMAAGIAGLSPSRFSHLFVEQTGQSFKTYLLWIRLTHALRLMGTAPSLTAVAHEAGFSDSAHFTRTFRRMFGVAPTNLKLI